MNTELETHTEAQILIFRTIPEGRVFRHRIYGVCHKLRCIFGQPVALARDEKAGIGIMATAFSLSLVSPIFVNGDELVSPATGSEVDPEPERFVDIKYGLYIVRGRNRQKVSRFDRREGVFV